MFTAQHPHRFEARIARTMAVALALIAVIAALAIIAVERLAAPSAAAPASAATTVSPLPLSDRVLAPSTVRGFIRTAPPATIRPTGRLERLGFIAGVNEQLHGVYPLKAQAVSIVERFRTAGAAQAELTYRYRTFTSGHAQTPERLSVAGIPGAVGWSEHADARTDTNIMFTSGSYYYLVGAGVDGAGPGAPTRTNLIAAAQTLYLMTNGCVTMGTRAHLA
jgi:hypothetical protein